MKINADQVKAAVASYWRYHRSCTLVALEAIGGQYDVMVVTNDRIIIDIEVKTSLGDLRGDKKKPKHMSYNKKARHHNDLVICYFYFAVPKDMAVKASLICDQLYPYAGVIGTDCRTDHVGYLGHDIQFYRKARLVPPERKKANVRDLIRLTKDQSGTVCRLAGKVATLKKQLKFPVC